MKIKEILPGLFITECGRVFKESSYSHRGNTVLKYKYVNWLRKKYDVHRLVALAFIPRVDGKNWVLHNNDNSMDNRKENLRWGTPKENAADAWSNGRFDHVKSPHVERNREIVEKLLLGHRSVDIAKEYGISETRISQIIAKCDLK